MEISPLQQEAAPRQINNSDQPPTQLVDMEGSKSLQESSVLSALSNESWRSSVSSVASSVTSSVASSVASRVDQIISTSIYNFKIIYENRWKLAGTGGAWFFISAVFYGNGLYSGQVIKAMGTVQNAKGEALGSLFLQSIAYPGYILPIYLINRIGLLRLQILGFGLTAVTFFILAVCGPHLTQVSTLIASILIIFVLE
jgi:hypothetical protein